MRQSLRRKKLGTGALLSPPFAGGGEALGKLAFQNPRLLNHHFAAGHCSLFGGVVALIHTLGIYRSLLTSYVPRDDWRVHAASHRNFGSSWMALIVRGRDERVHCAPSISFAGCQPAPRNDAPLSRRKV